MCGIAGLLTQTDAHHIDALMDQALDDMVQRGPDGSGKYYRTYGKSTLALGHRRLAIIDLSDDGRQPMTSADGRFTISYNGEVYNYKELREELRSLGVRFRTDTDTEVILEAYAYWGLSSLPRLVGMFAFAIEDKQRQVIECFRDAFGIKPFLYHSGQDCFAFASDMNALRRLVPRSSTPNLQRAYDYLALGRYDDRTETFVAGISHLAPGHRLTVDLASCAVVETARWWNPSITERSDISFEDAADQVREAFLRNVRLHLRSDVPLGAALSGGVDSSALVCAMRHLEPDMDIHTFSYLASEGATNEEEWVDIVNAKTGAISHKVHVQDHDIFDDLDDMITSQGEPFGSTSIYAGYRVFKMAREAGIVVCIDGQGADEMLAGYHGYPHLRLRSLLEQGRLPAMNSFLHHWSKWPGRNRRDAIVRLISEYVPHTMQNHGRRVIGKSTVQPWLKADALRKDAVRFEPYARNVGTPSGKTRRLAEFERYLLGGGGLNHLLRHGDRNSMRWSIESRVPFLTQDFAELALSLPEQFLISDTGETKSVFRRAMRGIVPDTILDRRDKVGFETPELKWLRSDRLDIDKTIEPAAAIGIFHMDQLRKHLRAVLSGDKPFSWQAWRIINYCKWAELVLKT